MESKTFNKVMGQIKDKVKEALVEYFTLSLQGHFESRDDEEEASEKVRERAYELFESITSLDVEESEDAITDQINKWQQDLMDKMIAAIK